MVTIGFTDQLPKILGPQTLPSCAVTFALVRQCCDHGEGYGCACPGRPRLPRVGSGEKLFQEDCIDCIDMCFDTRYVTFKVKTYMV